MSHHIVKYTHDNGEKLKHPEYWCGKNHKTGDWYFLDAQHAVLSVGGSFNICNDCIKTIIKELKKELT